MEVVPYWTREYREARRRVLAGDPVCHEDGCQERATRVDHQPPLAAHEHLGEGRGCCVLLPHCRFHSDQQGGRIGRRVRLGLPPLPPSGPEVVDPAGYPLEVDGQHRPGGQRNHGVGPAPPPAPDHVAVTGRRVGRDPRAPAAGRARHDAHRHAQLGA